MRIEILNTDEQHPINPYLRNLKACFEHNHSISIVRSADELSHGELLFLVSCNEIVSEYVLKKFKHAMVLHASDLPEGRGWSPHVWKIIGGAQQITMSLLEAAAEVDSGQVYKKIDVDIPKSALWEEINDLLFNAEIQLIEFAIENFANLKKYPQRSDIEATYYRKRSPADSEIDPYKSISEQFNLIRVCDPKRYPAVFRYQGETYKLVLEKI